MLSSRTVKYIHCGDFMSNALEENIFPAAKGQNVMQFPVVLVCYTFIWQTEKEDTGSGLSVTVRMNIISIYSPRTVPVFLK